MPKLRSKKTIKKKHLQLVDLQKKKERIANSFAQINTSLRSKKTDGNQSDSNIFLDILRVAPLVVLTEEECDPKSTDITFNSQSRPYCKPSSSHLVPGKVLNSAESIDYSVAHNNFQKTEISSSICDLPLFTKNSTTLQKEEQEGNLMEDDSLFLDMHQQNSPKTLKSKCKKKNFRKKQQRKLFKKKKRAKRYFNATHAQSTATTTNIDNHSMLQIFGEINSRRSSSSQAENLSTNTIELSDEEEEIVFVERVCKSSTHKGSCSGRLTKKIAMSSPTPNSQKVKTSKKLTNGLVPTFVSRLRPSCPSAVIKLDNFNLFGLRYFEDVNGMEVSTAGHFLKRQLVVVSYNVLCQSTLERTRHHLYSHLHGPDIVYLSWSERRKLLEIELNRFQAHVFCLQEVEDTHFEEFFQPYFHRRNFLGIYKKRNGCSYPDGCAIFYDAKILQLVHKEDVSYNLSKPGMDRDNVGQIAIFELMGTKSQICVTNTHLLFNMKRGDIKLNQLHYLFNRMQETEQLIHKLETKSRKTFAGHILAGDFNIEPMSPIYRFVTDAFIQRNLFEKVDLALEMAALSFSQDQKFCAPLSIRKHHASLELEEYEKSERSVPEVFADLDSNIEHNFILASVYEHRLADGKCETSTYHRDSMCPDFIFYSVAEKKSETNSSTSESFIRLRKRLTLPCVQELDKACGRLPNRQSGSDHLALLAHFEVLCSDIL